MKKIEDIIDYDNVICNVMYDFCDSHNDLQYVFGKNFNCVIVPSSHPIYTGRLKALGYSLLNMEKSTISIIYLSSGSGISMLSSENAFMGKQLKNSPGILDAIGEFHIKNINNISLAKYDLPYIIIINNYEFINVFQIGLDVQKKDVDKFLSYLYKLGNIVFVSDLHSGINLKQCEKYDVDSINLRENSDLPVFKLFFSLAKKSRKKAKLFGYSNSSALDGNDKKCTGFGVFAF